MSAIPALTLAEITERGIDPALRLLGRTLYHAALYERTCPGCGSSSLALKKDIDRQCRDCANKARGTHGMASRVGPHPLYRVIKSAQARCHCPGTKDFKWYGARGIRVCEEWRENPGAFVAWALANGWRPGLDLDRRDNDGDYSPNNCQFITHAKNCRNKSNTRRSA